MAGWFLYFGFVLFCGASRPMASGAELTSRDLRRIPPDLSDAILRRGEWSFCAMEHSRIGAIEFDAPEAPFHHIALPLERVPVRFALQMDGRRQLARNAPDTITMIEAGASGLTRWDDTFESACFYFTNDALVTALGSDQDVDHNVRTRLGVHAPGTVRILQALYADAVAGQPHGSLVGDAIFLALASKLATRGDHRMLPGRRFGEAYRVRAALEYIHTNLTDCIDIASIARSAATSPFYLNHSFRVTLGCSIWQYVLRERAKYAIILMRDPNLSMLQISEAAGFATYASFISATRSVSGNSPAQVRRSLTGTAR